MNILCVTLVLFGVTSSIPGNLATATDSDKSEGFQWPNYNHNYQDINVANKTAAIDGLFNLARNSNLNGLKYIYHDTNYPPLRTAFYGLFYLGQHFFGDEYYKEFKHFVYSFIDNIYEDLDYEDQSNDDDSIILIRTELNRWACNYGYKKCIETFTEKFRKWRTNNNLKIEPNQRAVAYCTGIRYGTKDDWEYLWRQYIDSNSTAEQAEIIQALGCTQDSSLRERYLLNALRSFEESGIYRQNSTSVFAAVSSSGYDGAVYILDFIQKHHKKITEYYNGLENIASILSTASQGFSTQKAVDQFENLIKTHETEFKNVLSSLNNSLQNAKHELLWFENHKNGIVSRIRSYNNDNGNDQQMSGYRLPQDVAPLTYSIHIKPFVNISAPAFKFEGEVNITAKIKVKTSTIALHATTHVKYEGVSVSVGGKPVQIKNIFNDPKYDLFKIVVNDKLSIGQKVNIHLLFNGTINDKGQGLYRSWYRTDAGERRWLVATDLEPVGARGVFPCFDEPAMKANFTIKVTIPEEYNAISNSEKDTVIKHLDNQKTITFKETPVMSTYLLALVISDFYGITNYDSNTVWARPNAVGQARYALAVMSLLVQFHKENLNIPYQLEKLEMVALPDFKAGAMENWGLLTFKERNLLYLDYNSTLSSKQTVTNVISHEIAHQWFGDMVSPAWWSYTWLNEGFATYFEYFATAHIKPDWSLESQFVVDQLHAALDEDSSNTSHPMTLDVNSPAEIEGLFDTISYNKAASVLRMMSASFGDTIFYKSLQKYLKKQQYGVATPENLFDAFKEEISDANIKNSIHDIMNSWTKQAGYPVVHVSFKHNRLNLTQERFLINGKDSKTLWKIPITWTTIKESNFNNTKPKYWLNKMSETIDLPNDETDLFIFNVGQSGYYRVNYDYTYWQRIIKFLKSHDYYKIDEINRAMIIDDLMNFAKAGDIDYDTALSATQYLVDETSYIPLKAFFTGLTQLRRQLQGRDAYGAFKKYVTAIITPIYGRLGFTDGPKDSHTTRLLKIQLRKWACEMEVGDCQTTATRLFLKPYIPPNYRSTVYCMIAKTNTIQNWKTLMERYMTTTMASDKALILQSLACTTEPKFLDELLQKAISMDLEVRKEDSTSVFSYVIEASLEGTNAVMNFIEKNYDKMVDYYGGNSEIASIVKSVGKRVTTNELYSKYINLITWLAKKHRSHNDNLNSYKSIANEERAWASKYIPKLFRWMDVNYPSTDHRLPKLFSPLKYNISMSPNLGENFLFYGKVQIEMQQPLLPTSRIVLNIKDLLVKKVNVYYSKGNLIKGEEVKLLGQSTIDEKAETLTVYLAELVYNKNVIIEIEYTGILNEDMIGFYRSYYKDGSGNIHWLATTQFQTTYARMAFPCLDEPAYKATFTINIERPKDYTALSNMPSVNVKSSNVSGFVWERFDETAPMSTNAVAFVVSDLKPVRDENTNVTVWSRPDMAVRATYAQKAAKQMLEYLHDKTGIKYALPKLDLVAVPDLLMGGFENWGLITMREDGIQYSNTVTSSKFEDYVITIIAHELSRMWFGHLVTSDWRYSWLNEGFAEYMQWIISNMFHPSHEFNDLFVVDELQQAMLEDDYVTSHPMNRPVYMKPQINDVSDIITYGKGSSVLRMVEHAFGTDVFLKAVNRYLSRHKYNTTTPKDLWQVFDEVINETRTDGSFEISVETLMDAWTNEAGYPIVDVDRIGSEIRLKQYRLSYIKDYDPIDLTFWIPISIATSSNPSASTTPVKWLGKKETFISVGNSMWYLLNVQQTGYYRVMYDNYSWYVLIDALYQKDYSNIHVTNRAQLIDDALNLARANKMSYRKAFECTDYLRNETEYLPWKAFFNGMNFLLQRSEGRGGNLTSVINSYILHLTSNIYKSLDIEDSIYDDHSRKLSRELMLTWRCKAGDGNCTKKANDLYDQFHSNVGLGLPNPIPPNVRSVVYCTMMRDATYEEWNFMWLRYLNADFASEKRTILEALGCSRNAQILKLYINRAISGTNIRKQDADIVLSSVYNAGQVGVNVMTIFLTSEYMKLHEFYGEWHSVQKLFSKLASHISTWEQFSLVERTRNQVNPHIPEISFVLDRTVMTAMTNLEWYNNKVDDIYDHLNMTVSKWNGRANAAVSLHISNIISLTLFYIIVYVILH